MIITKNSILDQVFDKLKINGKTVRADSDDMVRALARQDSYIAALPWDVGYLQPSTFGDSDPDDDSGITIDILDPITTILASNLASSYGQAKVAIVSSPQFASSVMDAMATLARKFVEIEGGKYPDTLPVGIANEYPNTLDSYFYRGGQPSENDEGNYN